MIVFWHRGHCRQRGRRKAQMQEKGGGWERREPSKEGEGRGTAAGSD